MGHVINPISKRLGYSCYWPSNWSYFKEKNYTYLLLSDLILINFFNTVVNLKILRFYFFFIAKFLIIRTSIKTLIFLKIHRKKKDQIFTFFPKFNNKKKIQQQISNEITEYSGNFVEIKENFFINTYTELKIEKCKKHFFFTLKQFYKFSCMFRFSKKNIFINLCKNLFYGRFSCLNNILSNKKFSKKLLDQQLQKIKNHFKNKKNFSIFKKFYPIKIKDNEQKNFSFFNFLFFFNFLKIKLNFNKKFIATIKIADKRENLQILLNFVHFNFEKNKNNLMLNLVNNINSNSLKFNYKIYKKKLFDKFIFSFFLTIIKTKLKKINENCDFLLVETKRKINANFICNFVSRNLIKNKKKLQIRYIIKAVIEDLKNFRGVKGFKISVSGRFSRKQRANCYWENFRSVPLNTLNIPIDYYQKFVTTKYGLSCVRVWLYKQNTAYFDNMKKRKRICYYFK